MENRANLPVLNNQTPRRGMRRREMVQRLFGGAGAAMALPGVLGAHPVHKHLADPAVLAERMVPGSTRAQVNRFIDLLLGVDSKENQKRFQTSLAAFEAVALDRHGQPFKDLTEEQQNQILTGASIAKPGRNQGRPARQGSSPPSETQQGTLRDDFENLKGWVSGAYYSSETGMRQLGWTGDYFFESFPGCRHPEGHH